jgi:hypothetical protein
VECASGEVCLDGACSTGCGQLTQCGASCVDLQTSDLHCGACDTACASGLSCTDGECTCPAGQTRCGTTCADVATDPNHCGACDTRCGPGASCVGGTCQCGATVVSFARDVQPIFTASCVAAGCHSGARPKEELSLVAGEAYAELVGVATNQCGGARTLVEPGNGGASYLMQKLLGVDLCSGSQMPKAGQSIPVSELETISNWICQGAPDN